MKIILENEEIKKALEQYVQAKLIGNPELIISSQEDVVFEILINY